MRRIRLALLAIALGLGVPVALLAWRALEGLALERAVRHQALAERAFDEMERLLSRWLEQEEARPFEHYRFYVKTPEQRSPLAQAPSEAFVVGAFQIDPDGSVHTPMRPRDPAAAAGRGHWPPPDAEQQAIARVTRVVRDAWRDGAGAEARESDVSGVLRKELPAAEPEAVERQDPGTTRPLGGPLAGKRSAAKTDLDDAVDQENVYDVLQRFNRGADLRAERKQKIAAVRIPPPMAPAPEPARTTEASRSRAGATAREAAESEVVAGPTSGDRASEVMLDELEAGQLRALGYVFSEALPAEGFAGRPEAEIGAEAQAGTQRQPEALRLALDPMVGRPAGDGLLLLYRTVLAGEQGYRQGLVLDRERLGLWLAERALAPSGLSRVATVRFETRGVPDDADFVFQHRFAEPFDAITAQLSLVALAGVGRPGAIYGLVALLAVVGAAGLLAIHRMVAVAVHFAERRSNFVAAVTHELKTPLTAIRMYGEMLRDGLVPSEAKKSEYYGTITDESERLSRLIDNVLELSRLERGAREMNWSVGPVGPVVREAADRLRAHARQQGFCLDVEIEPELPAVRYDRDALLQVLFNLVDNAMKYAGGAEPRRVVLEAKRRDTGVELAVRDFGPGVAGRHLSRIFEPFYRGEDELTRSAKGTGIGLALVRDLAERMGAGVRGANAPDGGFRVCLAFEAAGPA